MCFFVVTMTTKSPNIKKVLMLQAGCQNKLSALLFFATKKKHNNNSVCYCDWTDVRRRVDGVNIWVVDGTNKHQTRHKTSGSLFIIPLILLFCEG